MYLRLLRTEEDQVLNPEAYLFTVANNLLKEQAVMRRRQKQVVDLTHPAAIDALRAEALSDESDPARGVDFGVQIRGLRSAFLELSPRCQLVLVMSFEEGLSYQEIALRLGVSKTMVRKILTQAIGQCRMCLRRLEAT